MFPDHAADLVPFQKIKVIRPTSPALRFRSPSVRHGR